MLREWIAEQKQKVKVKRMKKEKNLYEFTALSEEIQKKVIAKSRDINLTTDWFKEVSDAWNKRLMEEGYQNLMLHFTGFYRKNDGACFEGDLNGRAFMQLHNIKKMIRAGIDIMFIRRVLKGDAEFRARLTLSQTKSQVWNQKRMRVAVRFDWGESEGGKRKGTAIELSDPFTRKMIEDYILKRSQYLAGLFYDDLKKKYDVLISDRAVSISLEAVGWRRLYDAKGNLQNRVKTEEEKEREEKKKLPDYR